MRIMRIICKNENGERIKYVINILYYIIILYNIKSYRRVNDTTIAKMENPNDTHDTRYAVFWCNVVLHLSKRRFMVSYFLTYHDIVVPLQCQKKEIEKCSHTRP